MRPSAIVISLCVFGLSAPVATAAELIVNGGFEVGNFTPIGGSITTYDLITSAGPQDLTGWSVTNSLVWGLNPTDINPRTGNGFVDLTGVGDTIPHGGLSQTIGTVIGQQYAFSVFATQDFVNFTAFEVFANAVELVLSGSPGFWDYSPTGATYGQVTSTFTADSAFTTIGIFGLPLGSTQFMIGLDDVSVTGPTPGPIPLPAAFPLLAAGLGALGLLARRSRHKSATAE